MLENNLPHNSILLQMFIGILIPVLLLFTYIKLITPLLKCYNERKKQLKLSKKMKNITIHPLIEFRIKTALDNFNNPMFYLEYRNANYEIWETLNFYKKEEIAEKKLRELTHKKNLVSVIKNEQLKITKNLKEKIYQQINNKATNN